VPSKEIVASFKLQGLDRGVKVSVKQNMAEAVVKEMSKGAYPEKLAIEISQLLGRAAFCAGRAIVC
jgi:hypothetical protein